MTWTLALTAGAALGAFVSLHRWWKRRVEGAQTVLKAVVSEAISLEELPQGEYLPGSREAEWIEGAGRMETGIHLNSHRRFLRSDEKQRFAAAREVVEDPRGWASRYNTGFVARRLTEIAPWSEVAIGTPLTTAQQKAIVRDDDVNLIVAGAGTGKTSTILGKVLYLLDRGLATPDEVLVLAYNKKVAGEVRTKMSALGRPGVTVSTFHSMAFRLLGEAEGARPPVSSLATSEVELAEFLSSCFETLVLEEECWALLRTWWIDLMVEWVDIEECKTEDERLRKEAGLGLVAFNGVRLASQSEVKLANALSMHGIRWEYEKRYPHTPSSPDHRDYTPDFFLPDHDIWIELWGCWRDPKRGKDLSPEYRSQIEWKRDLHSGNRTVLVEFFLDEIWGGRLENAVRDLLVPRGVPVQEIAAEAQLALLQSGSREVRRFVKLVGAFLSLKRGGGWDLEGLREKATSRRDEVFLDVFRHFEERYEERLGTEGKIDFDEMLLRANTHLRSKRVSTGFRYILVDEFQDISRSRVEFLKLLRSQRPGSHLFLVGDDWQSIYRFAGSDLDLFVNAPSRLGPTVRTDLDWTFRLESDLLDVSSRFVTRNPSQLRKELHARTESGEDPGISIRYFEKDQLQTALAQVLDDIAVRTEGPTTVLLLARYNHVFDDVELNDSALTDSGRIGLRRSTVHAAKGLEADHVVILNVGAGTYGFPSEIADDRVLRLVTQGSDDFPNAEERRLFYVALTRTKGRAYILVPANKPSGFVQELLREEYADAIEVFGEKSERYRCPLCHGMTIRQKSGAHGTFWACIHYARCDGKLRECAVCKDGVIEPAIEDGKIPRFVCTGCEVVVAACPRCRTGALLSKSGAHGVFFGCSNWRRDGSGCGHTENA